MSYFISISLFIADKTVKNLHDKKYLLGCSKTGSDMLIKVNEI